jgi:hypothetical protein
MTAAGAIIVLAFVVIFPGGWIWGLYSRKKDR